MSDVDLEDGEWQTIQIGPEIVGWVGPHDTVKYQNFVQAEITVFSGDQKIDLNITALGIALLSIEAYANIENVMRMLYYSRRFAIRIPEGSLEDVPGSVITYSPRTTETLHTALDKLFSAVSFMVQAELHECESPVKVVRKYATLDAHGYPSQLLGELTWRGLLLNDLLTNTELKARVVDYDSTPVRKAQYRNGNLGSIQMVPDCSEFGSFVSWQTRSNFNYTRAVPENVFLLLASSQEEYEQGKQLLQDETSLTRFLTTVEHKEITDATFFVCPAGDPLEEWVDGEVLSVEDFLLLLQRDGHLQEVKHGA